MGDWHQTCFISNLPILAGDRVVLFVLGPTTYKAGMAYEPDDIFVPLGFPIIGEYNDCGGIEHITIKDSMTKYLKSLAIYTSENGDNQEIKFVKYKYETAEQFVEKLSEDELFVDVPDTDEKCPLSFTMMHYDLYQLLIKNMGSRIPYKHTNTLEVLIRNRVTKSIEQMQSEINELKCEADEEYVEAMRHYINFNAVYRLNSFVWNSLNDIVNIYIENPDTSILTDMTEYILWSYVMSYGRKGYHCYSGFGSQRTEYKIHQIIANFILKKCEEQKLDNVENQLESGFESPVFFFED